LTLVANSKGQVATLVPRLILEVQLQADVFKIEPCRSNRKRISAFQTKRSAIAGSKSTMTVGIW
jgi:hypothetical protein